MNVEGQYNPKDVECIPVENLEVLPSGADWQSRHLESERRKAEIRDRIHKQAEQGQKTAKDYFRPAKPTPSIYDSDLKRVAVYARVSTSSEEQISSIENQTLYYTKKIAETENWNFFPYLCKFTNQGDFPNAQFLRPAFFFHSISSSYIDIKRSSSSR